MFLKLFFEDSKIYTNIWRTSSRHYVSLACSRCGDMGGWWESAESGGRVGTYGFVACAVLVVFLVKT